MVFAATLLAETGIPRFEDYPSPTDWHGPAAAIKLITSSEQMFRTRLTETGKEPPNFAGHYKITYWGCGSECSAGAVIDLQSDGVYPPAFGGKGKGWQCWISCAARFEGTDDEFHLNSRLMITRCGSNFDQNGKNHPDVYYMLWDGSRFKELMHLRTTSGKLEKVP